MKYFCWLEGSLNKNSVEGMLVIFSGKVPEWDQTWFLPSGNFYSSERASYIKSTVRVECVNCGKTCTKSEPWEPPERVVALLNDDQVMLQEGCDWHWWSIPWLLFEVPGWSASVSLDSFISKGHWKGLKKKHAVLNQVMMSTSWLCPSSHGAELRGKNLSQGWTEPMN